MLLSFITLEYVLIVLGREEEEKALTFIIIASAQNGLWRVQPIDDTELIKYALFAVWIFVNKRSYNIVCFLSGNVPCALSFVLKKLILN